MSSHVLAVRECLIGDRHNAEIKTASELVSASKIFVEDGNHGENRPRQDEFCDQGNGIPFLRPPDLKEGRVDFRNCDFINAQGYARVRKGIGKPGDVILTHRATVGRIAITGSDAPTVFVTNPGTTIWRSLDKDLLDQRYLYFYMSSRIFQDRLFSEVGHTSTFDYVSLTQQRTLPVVIPEIRLQRQIAHILGTLDDKIELNRKTNETLEAMAKALFKSWFVDFDPVRAKAEGRPTGLPSDISDLFPDSFEDSELGEIPSGWQVTSLGEVIELAYGKPLKEEQRKGGAYPVFGSNGVVGSHDEYLVKAPGIVVGRKGNPGTVEWSGKNFYPIDTTFFVVNKKAGLGMRFLFYCLRNQNLADLSADSAVPGLNRNHAYMNNQLLPATEVASAFERHLEVIFKRKEFLAGEINALSATRDALLPKLISGEIRIPDAEKMLEEVGV